MAKKDIALGIDVGGSGIKGAPVDVKKGEFTKKRKKILTPRPATPEAVIEVIGQIVQHFEDEIDQKAPIGITVPAVVQHGVVRSAANIDTTWIDFQGERAMQEALRRDVTLVNDADAAGYAEMLFGAAKDDDGLVIVTTLGTGIGTALFYRNVLIPNTELGHIEIDGQDAETQASSRVKDTFELSYAEWALRLQKYYTTLEKLFSPDLFVVGGGVSRQSDQFLPLLHLNTPIVPATMQNQAGIVGAAKLAAEDQGSHHSRAAARLAAAVKS